VGSCALCGPLPTPTLREGRHWRTTLNFPAHYAVPGPQMIAGEPLLVAIHDALLGAVVA
jgi:hypothetical protein